MTVAVQDRLYGGLDEGDCERLPSVAAWISSAGAMTGHYGD